MTKDQSYCPIEPLVDKVVISPDIPEYKSAGGIIIPDMAKKTPETGTVLAVGDDIEEVVPGDKVHFGKNLGKVIVIADEAYLIMDEDKIFAVIN